MRFGCKIAAVGANESVANTFVASQGVQIADDKIVRRVSIEDLRAVRPFFLLTVLLLFYFGLILSPIMQHHLHLLLHIGFDTSHCRFAIEIVP